MVAQNSRWALHGLASPYQALTAVYPRRSFFYRTHSMPTSLEASASLQPGDNSSEDEDPSTDTEEETLAQPLTSEQVVFFSHFIVVIWKAHSHFITVTVTDMFLTFHAPEIEEIYLIVYLIVLIKLIFSSKTADEVLF